MSKKMFILSIVLHTAMVVAGALLMAGCGIDEDIDSLNESHNQLQTDLNLERDKRLASEKEQGKRIEDLEREVKTLNARIDNQDKVISNLEDQGDDLQLEVDNLKLKDKKLEEEHGALEHRVRDDEWDLEKHLLEHQVVKELHFDLRRETTRVQVYDGLKIEAHREWRTVILSFPDPAPIWRIEHHFSEGVELPQIFPRQIFFGGPHREFFAIVTVTKSDGTEVTIKFTFIWF